jgi:hypothetical protein
MEHFVWYSTVAGTYLVVSFVVATCVGRWLRHASAQDFNDMDVVAVDRAFVKARVRPRDEPIGVSMAFTP